MKVLSADDILGAKDVKLDSVDVPEWGGRVYVREFSARVREEFEEALYGDRDDDAPPDQKNVRARVVALAACDATGKALFTLDQAAALAEKSNDALARVYDRAAALNRLRAKDRTDEKKESAAPPPAGSPTA